VDQSANGGSITEKQGTRMLHVHTNTDIETFFQFIHAQVTEKIAASLDWESTIQMFPENSEYTFFSRCHDLHSNDER